MDMEKFSAYNNLAQSFGSFEYYSGRGYLGFPSREVGAVDSFYDCANRAKEGVANLKTALIKAFTDKGSSSDVYLAGRSVKHALASLYRGADAMKAGLDVDVKRDVEAHQGIKAFRENPLVQSDESFGQVDKFLSEYESEMSARKDSFHDLNQLMSEAKHMSDTGFFDSSLLKTVDCLFDKNDKPKKITRETARKMIDSLGDYYSELLVMTTKIACVKDNFKNFSFFDGFKDCLIDTMDSLSVGPSVDLNRNLDAGSIISNRNSSLRGGYCTSEYSTDSIDFKDIDGHGDLSIYTFDDQRFNRNRYSDGMAGVLVDYLDKDNPVLYALDINQIVQISKAADISDTKTVEAMRDIIKTCPDTSIIPVEEGKSVDEVVDDIRMSPNYAEEHDIVFGDSNYEASVMFSREPTSIKFSDKYVVCSDERPCGPDEYCSRKANIEILRDGVVSPDLPEGVRAILSFETDDRFGSVPSSSYGLTESQLHEFVNFEPKSIESIAEFTGALSEVSSAYRLEVNKAPSVSGKDTTPVKQSSDLFVEKESFFSRFFGD